MNAQIRETLDAMMAALWVLAYVLVLIGTIRYKYPLIAPVAQMVILPFEMASLIYATFQLKELHVILAYIFWASVDLAIVWVIIKNEYISRKRVIPYCLSMVCTTLTLYYLFVEQNAMYFFSYFNTYIGEIIWFLFILRKDFPMKLWSLAAFVSKFVADVVAIFVYINDGGMFIGLMCITLPLLDFLFLVVYFYRAAARKKRECRQLQ